MRQRLLAEHVPAGAQRVDDGLLVEARRGAHGDDVDVVAIEQLPVVAAGKRDRVPLDRAGQALVVEVGDRDDPRAVGERRERARVLFEDQARPDDPDAQRRAHPVASIGAPLARPSRRAAASASRIQSNSARRPSANMCRGA